MHFNSIIIVKAMVYLSFRKTFFKVCIFDFFKKNNFFSQINGVTKKKNPPSLLQN